MQKLNKLPLALLLLVLLAPAFAQEVIGAEDFDIEAVEPYGNIGVAYEPYDEVALGAIILSHTTPADQHANFDVVGPNGYWEHFDFSDDPGAELVLDDLLPGIYSVAASDEGLELVHTVVEVRVGEAVAVHVNLLPWEGYVAGAFDPYAYYGPYSRDLYPGYPYGAYTVGPYEPFGAADAGAIIVDTDLEETRFVVTGPNGYSESFEGDFAAQTLWPGVYAVAATREGFDLAVTTVEVQPALRLAVVPVLVTLPAEDVETEVHEAEEAQPNSIQVTVEPAEATVVVTGPGGYMTEFTGSQTLTDLEPGTYVFAATLDDHSPVEQEVQLEQDGSETVELTLPQESQ